MDNTVYEYLSDALSKFAKDRGIYFRYEPLDKECPDIWKFGFYGERRTWTYTRYLDVTVLERLRMHGREYADYVVEAIRESLLQKGVIMF